MLPTPRATNKPKPDGSSTMVNAVAAPCALLLRPSKTVPLPRSMWNVNWNRSPPVPSPLPSSASPDLSTIPADAVNR